MQARPPFAYLTAGNGPVLCRHCSRLPRGEGLPGGVALYLKICRGFAAGRPILAVRRPRQGPGAR